MRFDKHYFIFLLLVLFSGASIPIFAAAVSDTTLKSYFEPGDRPKSTEFQNLIDSKINVDGSNFPDPLPAVDAAALLNIPIPDPLPVIDGRNLTNIKTDEWQSLPAGTNCNYVTSTSLNIAPGDWTGEAEAGRRFLVSFTNATPDEVRDVSSAIYDSGNDLTTVVFSATMTSGLIDTCKYGVFTSYPNGAISAANIGAVPENGGTLTNGTLSNPTITDMSSTNGTLNTATLNDPFINTVSGEQYSTKIGKDALNALDTSIPRYSSAFGSSALKYSTTGVANSAFGYAALVANTTGQDNSAYGFQALASNTTGNSNTAIGSRALLSNTASGNAAFGMETLTSNTTGAYNTAVGNYALKSNVSGLYNSAIGYAALENNSASNNTAVGVSALSSNTTGTGNTAVASSITANTTGSYNSALGYQALGSNVIGNYNSAFGYQALNASTASFQSAFGYLALKNNTTGAWGSAFGHEALLSNTTGGYNTAFGATALRTNSTGSSNTAIGHGALYTVNSDYNTAVGFNAGLATATGTNNTSIGYNANPSSSSASNEVTLGNSSVTAIRAQVTTITALSDRRDKTNIRDLNLGLGFVSKLRPVRFDWAMRDGGKFGIEDTGFIAQDLQAAQSDGDSLPGLVYASNPERLEAGYGKLLPVLVKAIQELSEKVEALETYH
ncbi:MAG: tail fiber domain-containing protein [Gammaproteobacteria bacterium]|nr:tail fiber domain-containing protein [Gammaproteobacteria bacterium]